jgi:hypothetical protein
VASISIFVFDIDCIPWRAEAARILGREKRRQLRDFFGGALSWESVWKWKWAGALSAAFWLRRRVCGSPERPSMPSGH